MLPVHAADLRIFLHVLAATVWVGGQIVLAGVVPAVRPAGPATVSAVARRFQQVAWPAYAILVITGVWNLLDVRFGDATSAWQATLFVKLSLVALSGIGAGLHTVLGGAVRHASDEATARRLRALSGASAGFALLAAIGALFLGILL